MNPVYWVLAVAVLAACLFVVFRLRARPRAEERRLPPEVPHQEQPPPVTAPDDEVPDAQTVAIAQMIHDLKSRYANATRSLAIPPHTVTVPVNATVFGIEKREILHFLWETEPNLHLFPVWDDIQGILENTGGALSLQPGDENDLRGITIPKNRVDFWRVLQSGGVEVFYTSASGERVDMILRSAPPEPFRDMLPDKEENYIISYIYPKSSKNIFDIKDEFNDLKARLERGELSQEEYDREKKMILIMM